VIWFSFSKVFPGMAPFIKWCASTGIGMYVSHAAWAFKFIETIHILAWVVLIGTTMLVNLRLLGILRGWDVEHIARNVSPFIYTSLSLVTITGVLMFLSNAGKYYQNVAFAPKIMFFVVALFYQFIVYRFVVRRSRKRVPIWARFAGGFSLLLWFAVGAAGRAIGAL
jgi:hypothetical protein